MDDNNEKGNGKKTNKRTENAETNIDKNNLLPLENKNGTAKLIELIEHYWDKFWFILKISFFQHPPTPKAHSFQPQAGKKMVAKVAVEMAMAMESKCIRVEQFY